MRVIKYKVFEELIIDTTKTIENLKAGLVELEDLGFKVEVKWTRYDEILFLFMTQEEDMVEHLHQ